MIKLGKVRISPVFIGMLAVLVLLDGTVFLLVLLLSMALHETMHLAAIARVGGRVERVELRAFRISIRLERESCLSYRDDVIVALAGPVGNVLAAVVLTLWCVAIGAFPGALFAVTVNVLLCALNLLPIESLDGGRALRAALLTRLDLERADRLCGLASWVFIVPLLALAVGAMVWTGYNLSLAAIAVYLLMGMMMRQGEAPY